MAVNLEFKLHDHVGTFAANGTLGDQLRRQEIEPHWEKADKIVLNFVGVSSMTDSFVNAFIGNLVEGHPADFKSKLRFVNCSPLVTTFIKGALQFASKRMSHA
ncbi:MAG: STAS-like domain-containing protein [Akkermansiaceae bacterium]|nr:STAS-like domain-containing protein [Akkermansiaceae bacterium]